MRSQLAACIVMLASMLASHASADDFTIVIFGDTQTYTDSPLLEPVFENMVDYVIDHVASDDIALVLQVGDVIQQGVGDVVTASTTDEWTRFNTQWKRFDGVVPYSIVRGNHDNTQEFSLHYGAAVLTAFPHYLTTHAGEDDDAHAWVVDLGGQDAIVLGISCNPSGAELAWAQGVLDGAPELPAIVMSHILTNVGGYHQKSASLRNEPSCNGNPPLSLWDDLVAPNADQVFLTASGHFINPVRGSKTMRETVGAGILDTFQNWQGGASADGCMTLVRFRPALQEVEVEAFCTELNAGAGAFLDAPTETTLPTITMDDECVNFSLFDGVGQAPDPCVPPPVPITLAGFGRERLVMSFGDDATIPNSLPFRSITVSAGSLLNLWNSRVLDDSEITGSLLLESDEVFIGPVEDIDAAHFRSDGQVIFSTSTSATVAGVLYTSGDLILYDPATGGASLFFDEANFASPKNVDALYLFETGPHTGKLLLSTSSPANLGGLVFDPGDLVLYDPIQDTSTLYFDQDLITGTAGQRNIDAVHVMPNGRLLLSVLISGGHLGANELTLLGEDGVAYTAATDHASSILLGADLFNGITANLDALTMVPNAALVPALSAGAVLVLALGLGLGALLLLERRARRAC